MSAYVLQLMITWVEQRCNSRRKTYDARFLLLKTVGTCTVLDSDREAADAGSQLDAVDYVVEI